MIDEYDSFYDDLEDDFPDDDESDPSYDDLEDESSDDDESDLFFDDSEDEFPDDDEWDPELWRRISSKEFDEFFIDEGEKFIYYGKWAKKKRIDSLKKLHDWFSDPWNQDERDDFLLDEEECLFYFLIDMPRNRASAEEIMSVMCVWEPYALYMHILYDLKDFLTREETIRLKDRRYRIWLQETHISSLEDIAKWFEKWNEIGITDLRLIGVGEGAYEHVQKFLEEMPLTRKSAETIMKYIDRFSSKELSSVLLTRFHHFLTEAEIIKFS